MGSVLSLSSTRKRELNDDDDDRPPSRKRLRHSYSYAAETVATRNARYDNDNSATTLTTLPPDILTSVLCRVPSTDHGALWHTCKALRLAIDSEAYCSERATSGWVEVFTRIVPKEKLWRYDNDCDGEVQDQPDDDDSEAEAMAEIMAEEREEDLDLNYSDLGRFSSLYHYHDIVVEVMVDGRVAGQIDLVLIPRGANFHYAVHDYSEEFQHEELQHVGLSLFDDKGRPRVRSIKDADTNGSAKHGGFLYVSRVRICPYYRPSDNTDVASKALNMAIHEPKLEGKWTLASAISDASVFFDDSAVEESMSDEEKSRIQHQLMEYSELDARVFLRVGFRQILESTCFDETHQVWLYAFPSFLTSNGVMSHDEALSMTLRKRPDALPPRPEGADEALLHMLTKACSLRSDISDKIPSVERKLASGALFLERAEQSIVNTNAQCAALEQRITEYNQLLSSVSESDLSLLDTDVQGQFERFRAQIEECRVLVEEKRREGQEQEALVEEARRIDNEVRSSLIDAREKAQSALDVLDRRVIDEMKELVQELGASVRDSFAIHCVSRHLAIHYLDSLLELLPPDERINALNDIEYKGCTPLMLSVSELPYRMEADDQHGYVEALLSRGADKNIVDPITGMTALGRYRNATRSDGDRVRLNTKLAEEREQRGDTEEAWRPIHERMEQTLMPTLGETTADQDAKDAESSDEESDGDDGDEE